jgi:CBS domain-containing protein
MTQPVISIKPEDQLADVISLMVRQKISGLPVVDDQGAVIGVMSEGDLLRRVELGTNGKKEGFWSKLFTLGDDDAERYRRVNGRRVRDVMTEKPAVIEVQDTLADAARLMHAFRVKRLPVVQDGRLVGILTRADFVKALARFLAPTYEDTIVSDDEIVTKVSDEIARQDWATAADVRVSCVNGKVTLRGYATDAQRRACVVAAEIIDGVRDVEDLMEVVELAPTIGL